VCTVISNPTPQRKLRGRQPTRTTARVANTAEHHARLAWRLTPRDRWLIRMLHEHRVLTTPQITALAFPSVRSAQQRLRELYAWRVTDRFQPHLTLGTAALHHVLAPAGAAVLAAEDGVEVKDLGYRHDRAMAIAYSLRLAHTVAVNDFFTALAAHARHASLTTWWSEARCGRHFGDLVRPDGYGRWRHHTIEIEFFLEIDLGTEPLSKVANKLTGYAELAAATAIATPVLVWLPTARREAGARRQLTRIWRDLDDPAAVPVATAAADLLNPHQLQPSPADRLWLPLVPTGPDHTGEPTRRSLHQLLGVWPHLPPPVTSNSSALAKPSSEPGPPIPIPPAA
jgi:Replication-relaxation